jgi:hypothetical protein
MMDYKKDVEMKQKEDCVIHHRGRKIFEVKMVNETT